MIAASSLVCTQIVRSENIGVVLCNKSLVVSPTPIGDSVGFVDVPSNGIGFSSAEDWFRIDQMADASAVVAIRIVVMTMFQINERSHSATVQKDYSERRCRRGEVRVRLMADLSRTTLPEAGVRRSQRVLCAHWAGDCPG